MKPITEYQDYREFMRDFYEERKRSSLFSWREFSKLAGFTSPNYVQLVCEGKSRLSKTGVEKVAEAMGLAGADRDYFLAMERFGDAKNDATKIQAFNEMQKIAKENRLRVVDAEAFKYFESWVNPVLRELAPIMPGATLGEIASKIRSDTTGAQVRDILQFLVKANLLKKNNDGTYEQTQKSVKGSKETIPLVIRAMNKKMTDLAAHSIANDPVEERNFSGVTMGIDKPTYDRITKEIDAFRKKIVDIANECQSIDQVYQMNLQIFPLTDKIISKDLRKTK